MYKNLTAILPLGQFGLDGSDNYFTINPAALVVASNVRLSNQTIEKVPGMAAFDATGVGASRICYGGFDWRPSSANQYQVTAWDNGSLFRSGGSNLDATTLASGQGYTEPAYFVTGGKIDSGDDTVLYVFSKDVRPQQVTGTGVTTANLTNDAADWTSNYPGAAIFHDGRIYAFDQTGAEHTYYVSSLLDHGDFSIDNGARAATVFKGQGERISSMISYIDTILYVFKYPFGIYKVDTLNITGYMLGAEQVRDDVGCAGPGASIKVGNDILFVSSNGRLYSLLALSPDRDPKDADITEAFNLGGYIDANLDRSRLKWIKLAYDENTKNLYYYFTSLESSDTINDKAIVFNLENPGQPRVSIEERGQYFNAAWVQIDSSNKSRLLVGGEGGKVYSIDSNNRNLDGSAYTAEIQTPETDFSFVDPRLQGTKKRFDYLELYILPTGNYDVDIDFIVDGESVVSRSINLSSAQAEYDTGVYDTAAYADSRPVRRTIPINAWGETLSIRWTNSGLNENFKLIRYKIMFKALGESYEA